MLVVVFVVVVVGPVVKFSTTVHRGAGAAYQVALSATPCGPQC